LKKKSNVNVNDLIKDILISLESLKDVETETNSLFIHLVNELNLAKYTEEYNKNLYNTIKTSFVLEDNNKKEVLSDRLIDKIYLLNEFLYQLTSFNMKTFSKLKDINSYYKILFNKLNKPFNPLFTSQKVNIKDIIYAKDKIKLDLKKPPLLIEMEQELKENSIASLLYYIKKAQQEHNIKDDLGSIELQNTILNDAKKQYNQKLKEEARAIEEKHLQEA
jgi:hypothetical protein